MRGHESFTRLVAVETSLALENMVLGATGEGLGTCCVGSFDEDQVEKLLGVPENFGVLALLAIGYPREKEGFTTEFYG
jgi:nitroreductase